MRTIIPARKIHRFLLLLLVVAGLLFSASAAQADSVYDSRSQCWYSPVEGGLGVCLDFYVGNAQNYTVPRTIAGQPVVTVGTQFLAPSNVTSVTLHSGIGWIYDGAFQFSKVENVTFEGDIGLSSYAFSECASLKSLTVQGKVSAIWDYVFYGCNGLETVSMGCDGLTVPAYCFYGLPSLKQVSFHGSVSEIQNNAFNGCNQLKTLTVEGAVNSIDENAFNGCASLETVTIRSVGSIGSSAFKYCRALKSAPFLNSVTEIWNEAFRGCESLRQIQLSPNLKSIDWFAFYECTSLKEADIPDSVEKLGIGAFDLSTVLVVGQDSAAHRYVLETKLQGYRVQGGTESRDSFPITTLDDMVSAVVSWVTTPDMTQYQKAKALHDYVCAFMFYSLNIDIGHAAAALLFNAGACGSYAFAYQVLMEKAGMPCLIEVGTDHAYNVARVGGDWYYCDCTWDDAGDYPVYDYFLVPFYALEGVACHECFTQNHPAEGYKLNYYYAEGHLKDYADDIADQINNQPWQSENRITIPLTNEDFCNTVGAYDGAGILRRTAIFAAMHDHSFFHNGRAVTLSYSFDLASETATFSVVSSGEPAVREAGSIYITTGDEFTLPSPIPAGKTGTVHWQIITDLDEIWADYPGYFIRMDENGRIEVFGVRRENSHVWFNVAADITYSDGTQERVMYRLGFNGMMVYEALTLPRALETIESGAFEGGAFRRVVIGKQVKSISSDAFGAVGSLHSVVICGKNTQLDGDPFSIWTNDISLIVPEGSLAEQWAIAHDVPYAYIP